MSFLWAFLLVAILLIAWGLTLLGMPGNWVMIGAAVVYVWLVPSTSPLALGWGVVLVLLALALLGELLEFLAGALGVAKAGGSQRGAVLALVGSLIGAVVGLFVGIPIPLVGSLVGAILLAGVGAFVGAILGEQWKGRDLGESYRVGKAAFWGRLLGTVAKTTLGAAMVATTVIAMIVSYAF